MRRPLHLLLVSALAPGALAAQAVRDAVAADPTHHNVILENEHVRVFEAMAAPGSRSPNHTHPATAIVSLGTARFRMMIGGNPVIFDLHPGQVLWLDSAEHSWEVISGSPHVIGIEVKAANRGRPAAVAPGPRDAVTVDPSHHAVVLENDHVRVIEAMAAPGDRSPMHTHPPLVLVSLGTGRTRMTVPGGNRVISDFHPGQVIWVPGAEHSWELLAGHPHVIAVEVKAARQSAR